MGIELQIQQFAAVRRKQIIRLFQIGESIFAVLYVVMVITAWLRPEIQPTLFRIGPKFGEVGAILLAITLIPGIIGRLHIFLLPRATLMMFRRHLGITTYLLVLAHSTMTYWLPSFTYGFAPLRVFQLFGILASASALPLFLTSNDYSVRVMKQWWHRVHKLAYLMLIFALFHTLLIEVGGTSLLLAGVGMLEIVSFLVQYRRDHATPRG